MTSPTIKSRTSPSWARPGWIGGLFASPRFTAQVRPTWCCATSQFEVYNIANNQITGAALLGTVGLDWQLGGFAAGSQPGSSSQLVQAMAGVGGNSDAAASLSQVPR